MKRNARKAARSKPETVSVGNIVVRIYKRTRPTAKGKLRTLFEVADHSAGRRRFRSFSDHGEARREAEKIARQLSTGDATAARMTNADAASFGRAVELLRPTGASLEMAAATYAKLFEILGGDFAIEAARFYQRHRADQVKRKPVAAVIAELIAAKQARDKSPRYIADLKARLTRFAVKFGADPSTISEPEKKDEAGNDTRNRGVDIGSITTADAQSFLDGLKVAPQTARNFRAVLFTLFSFAESRGYAFKGGNPVVDTERITANGGAIEIYSPDEIASLLKAASPDFLPFVALGAFAGLRAAETARIEWRDVDFAGGFIHVSSDNAKTRSRRLVPILQNLAQWLAPYAKRSGKVWTGDHNNLQATRAETVKAAGVDWKPNALRHSFISYRLADVQNAAQVSLEAGNSPGVVFKHYRELVKPSAAKSWFAVAPEAAANVIQMAEAKKAV